MWSNISEKIGEKKIDPLGQRREIDHSFCYYPLHISLVDQYIFSILSSPFVDSNQSSSTSQTTKSDSIGDKSSANPQQFCLRWNNYQTNLTNVFDQLLQNESFVDVTLACDGNSIKAHKMVLSACSPYFQSLFHDNPCQHPIVIMRDVKWPELTAVVEFMYKGEINVRQEQIAPLLRVAEMLKIRGLADVKSDLDLNSESEKSTPNNKTSTTAIDASIDSSPSARKPRITARTEWQINNLDLTEHHAMQQKHREQSSSLQVNSGTMF